MIREEYLHEMIQLKEIAGHLKRNVKLPTINRSQKFQVCLNNFINRTDALFDKMSYEYLEKEAKDAKPVSEDTSP